MIYEKCGNGFADILSDLIYDESDKSYSDALKIGEVKKKCKFVNSETVQRFEGRVMGVTNKHVVLSIGPEARICELSKLDQKPTKNEYITIVYDGEGQGKVKSCAKIHDKNLSRD